MSIRIATRAACAVLLMTLMRASAAAALTPNVIWSVPNGTFAHFSADGSSVLVTTPTGFQLRRAADGIVEKTLTLPSASLGYDARALSFDKTLVALALHPGGPTRIELWNLDSGRLVRTIQTDATRSIKALDFSRDGWLATYERFAYGGGGMVRVYRSSDGALVNTQGPYTRNSNTKLLFSGDGQYLAIQDLWSSNGVRVVRSSDWSTVLRVGNAAWLFAWSVGNNTLWLSGSTWQRVVVPAGTVAQSVSLDTTVYYPNAVTPDNALFLASSVDQTQVAFVRTSNGSVQVSYALGAQAYGSEVSPAGNLFTYGVCRNGTSCTLYAARPPAP